MPLSNRSHPVRIEPDDRLVVLGRTIDAQDAAAEAALEAGTREPARFGKACLGQALYRHRSIYRGVSDAPAWSHLALGYFRDLVPEEAIHTLVAEPQPAGLRLLRAELLLTTPASFVLPPAWQGSAGQPKRQASLEYIHVATGRLGAYRDVMRDYCGPAAARLVRSDRFGTFRAMETAAVLTRDPEFAVDWNQIHLCELDPEGFQGFGQEFEAALREGASDAADTSGVFAGLDALRTVPRWTFNDALVEVDADLTRAGRVEQ